MKGRAPKRRVVSKRDSLSPEARWRTLSRFTPGGSVDDALSSVQAVDGATMEGVLYSYETAVSPRWGETSVADTGRVNESRFDRVALGPGKDRKPLKRRKRPLPGHVGRKLDVDV
jgi:hypothetical protein